MDNCFIVCDLETTGLNTYFDKIIEVGLVRLADGQITDRFHTFINPQQPLSIKIRRLTGLTDQDLIDAPVLSEALPQILDFIGPNALAGHNVDFDLGFLQAALGEPLPNTIYDTLELARIVLPHAANFRLGTLCRLLNIEIKTEHRALEDAIATAQLLHFLIQEFRVLDITVLTPLTKLLAEARSGWHHFASEMLKEHYKVFPDKKISSRPYWRKESTAVEEPAEGLAALNNQSKGEKQLLDQATLAKLVGKDGPLVKAISGYEHRPQQEAMVLAVAGALNQEKYLLLEAGTGVGKSMGYLLPSLLWSLLNRERVVVATHTLNLQEQLWLKDIPVLKKVISQDFKVALAKGRQNYICLRRWIAMLNQPHQPEEAAFLAKALTWLSVTISGERSELNILPGQAEYWLSICGDTDSCIGAKCRYRKDCFVQKARKATEEANLIITNHSLLFLDIRNNNRILPAYGPLIIDESHHLEDSATTHLGKQVTQSLLTRWLNTIGKALSRMSESSPAGERDRWEQKLQDAMQLRLEALEKTRYSFQVLYEITQRKAKLDTTPYNSGRSTSRLPIDDPEFETFTAVGQEAIKLLRKLFKTAQGLLEIMDLWSISAEAWTEQAGDFSQIIQNGCVMIDELAFILESGDEEFVYWVDVEYFTGGGLKYCSLSAAPINVGPVLYQCFYQHKKTVIFTSATLSVNETFTYFIERAGLNQLPEDQLVATHFDSPFSYEHQALLCISRDLPSQGVAATDRYLEKLTNTILKLVEATEGKTLVLFTSHKTLRETYHRLKSKLEYKDIYLLGHGIDGSRTRILEEFRSSERTVLFGASSFWEGVDVPGEALSCVIIVKLPFLSPQVPIIEARLADLSKRNQDSFQSFSIPQAVIRFKQGFGRLIRKGSDRGCVVILDARILEKKYGRQFLRSLPLKSHIRGETDMIVKRIGDWFHNQA